MNFGFRELTEFETQSELFPDYPALNREIHRLFVPESTPVKAEFENNGTPSKELDEFDKLCRNCIQSNTACGKNRTPAQVNIVKMLERSPVRRRPNRAVRVCVFCRNNGETEAVYSSHQLKDGSGIVQCPILRAYTCPVCSASGDNAHTLKYCPLTCHKEPTRWSKMGRNSVGKWV